MENVVRVLLRKHSNIGSDADTLAADANLFDAGLSSFACVQVMMAIEEVVGVEYPDDMLTRRTFASISGIVESIGRLRSLALS